MLLFPGVTLPSSPAPVESENNNVDALVLASPERKTEQGKVLSEEKGSSKELETPEELELDASWTTQMVSE